MIIKIHSPLSSFAVTTSKLTLLRWSLCLSLWLSQVFRKLLLNGSDKITNCKCVGISGSCGRKSCWRSLPAIDDVVSKLKRLRHRVVHIPYKAYDGNNITRGLQRLASGSLAYYRRSPDYCRSKPGAYYYGTEGRECTGVACNTICCGRGTKQVTIFEDCRCKYTWGIRHIPCEVCESIRLVCRPDDV